MSPTGPPEQVMFGLDEALELLATLEDARDALLTSDHLAVLAGVEQQVAQLHRRLGFDER